MILRCKWISLPDFSFMHAQLAEQAWFFSQGFKWAKASEKRETRATEEGLISRPTPPSCFIRSKNAKNSACSWVRVGIKKINSGVLYFAIKCFTWKHCIFLIQKRLSCSGFKAVVCAKWGLFVISSYFSSSSGRMNTKLRRLDRKK